MSPPPRALSPRKDRPRVAALWGLASVVAWGALSADGLREEARAPWFFPALFAFVAALTGLVAAPRAARALDALVLRAPARAFVAACALAALALTAWFARGPMGGHFLARDSAVYWLQGRALAHGSFGVPAPLPRPLSGAHFLFEGVDGLLHGVFVPGYPLFLAPFTRLAWPLGAALAASLLLVAGHWALAREALVGPHGHRDDEAAARWSLVLPLATLPRAAQTADLHSHAFVAALSCLAAALALRLARGAPRPAALAVALGACVGWVFASRMLDGFVLGFVVAAALLGGLARRALAPRVVGLALAAALPFVALVALQQRRATGSLRTPTSVAYARNADAPSRCLRLGFARDIGCRVEHEEAVRSFGPEGYTPRAALRVVRQRAARVGLDAFGFGVFALLGVALLARRRDREARVLVGFPFALTLGYGLFYYVGNEPPFGARHLYPAVPFLQLAAAGLGARAGREEASRFASLPVAPALLLAALVVAPARFAQGALEARLIVRPRENLRDAMARSPTPRGLFLSADLTSYLAAIDPYEHQTDRALFFDDHAGAFEARRSDPERPVYLTLPGALEAPRRVPLPPVPAGFDLELERLWPSYLALDGLFAAQRHARRLGGLRVRGSHALMLFDAAPGATLRGRFDVAQAGVYALRLEGIAGPDLGRYEVLLDGQRVGEWNGYAERYREQLTLLTPEGAGHELVEGPHTLALRCLPRDPRSRGDGAVLDALTGRGLP